MNHHFSVLGCMFACMVMFGSNSNMATALPTIAPIAQHCDNGIFCAPFQTCMSNATGAGLLYACSPLPNAVRCMDARFSCPAFFVCADNSLCVASLEVTSTATTATNATTATTLDAVVNVDAFEVAEMRDFGSGMRPTALSVCGPITSAFRLPNFCTCRDARFGGELSCVIGIQTYITIGASAWVLPCASPSNFGYRAWVSLLGASESIGNTWVAAFTLSAPIPGASFEIGVARVGARAELSGDISRFVISTRVAIGACAKIGVGFFSKEFCNPSALPWLPVTIINGPRYDFTRFC
jgi:hypothetical protein